jgi:hypothetical protein
MDVQVIHLLLYLFSIYLYLLHQMSTNPNALLIFVTGQLKIQQDNPLHFSQVFQLVATGPGQYYVHNEIFRLVYG